MGLGAVNIDTKGIGNLFGSVGDMAVKVREALTGKKIADPVEIGKITARLAEIESAAKNGQLEINKAEAASGSRFIAGWRPFCGWVCVSGLIWGIFIHPIWVWLSRLARIVEPPDIQVAALITILIGMLGLGTQRSYEKKHGVQGQH